LTQELPVLEDGPCLTVPQVKNIVTSRDGRLSWEVMTHGVPDLDLDGCGLQMVLVPCDAPALYPDSMRWELFIMRGPCACPAGTIDGLDDPFLLPGWSHGLRNIGTMHPGRPGTAQSHGQVMTRYSFDGRK
jgi:hypothetical protein